VRGRESSNWEMRSTYLLRDRDRESGNTGLGVPTCLVWVRGRESSNQGMRITNLLSLSEGQGV